ncbi:MAG: amino acid ABC transporter permease [Coriobacteriia bacterium]
MTELLERIGFLQAGPFSVPRWEALFANMDLLWQGALVTLLVASLGLALSLALGTVIGVMSASQWKLMRGLGRAYVEFYQNTPLLIQVFMIFNALPILFTGMFIPVITIGILGVGMYHGAYIAEVVRAGIQSIGRGQLTNPAVSLIKNTSVLAVIAGGDLMYAGDAFAGRYGHYGPTYIVVGLLYFLMCFPLARLARRLESKAKVV